VLQKLILTGALRLVLPHGHCRQWRARFVLLEVIRFLVVLGGRFEVFLDVLLVGHEVELVLWHQRLLRLDDVLSVLVCELLRILQVFLAFLLSAPFHHLRRLLINLCACHILVHHEHVGGLLWLSDGVLSGLLSRRNWSDELI